MSLRNLTKERRDEIIKDQKEKYDKLVALQKKSPEDLYEDDLLNFELEYRKVIFCFFLIKSNKFHFENLFRQLKKNVLMKCRMLLIQQQRKLVEIIKLENDNQ
jgi:hypothetical protein